MNEVVKRIRAGGGRPRSSGAVESIAVAIGCELAVVQAIIDVEAKGNGFALGGVVKVLFEKHRFYQNLPSSKRAAAVKAGLARKAWISPAKGGYKDQPNNDAAVQMLARAIEVDEAAALKSASYGAGQVLGENFGLCGWPSVQAFVLDMCESEDMHLKAMMAFMEARGLADEMRAKDFDAIARVYNGSGQVATYGAAMRAAYQKHAGQPAAITNAVRAGGLRLGSSGYRVTALQQRLNELGYAVAVDADFGPATRRAVIAFQADNGLEIDGVVGMKTEAALDTAAPVEVSRERATATVSDLRAQGSEVIRDADITQIAGVTAIAGSVAKGASDLGLLDGLSDMVGQAGAIRETVIAPLMALIEALGGGWWAVALVGGMMAVIYASRIKQDRLADHKTGRLP